MLEAALFAGLAQAALLLGAVLVWRFRGLTKPARVGLIMAFGAGAVISAIGTDLVSVAYEEAGAAPTALGIGIGGIGYFLLARTLERSGESKRASSVIEEVEEASDDMPEGASPTEARNLLVGMVIDGVPESVSIGLTLHLGTVGVSAALAGSVFIAGLPEAIGVAAALLAGGFSLTRILARFSIIVVIGAVAGAVGYQLLVDAPADLIAIIQSIAAGALLVVVVNEMIPIAVRGASRWAGVLAACGFVFAAGMTWMAGG